MATSVIMMRLHDPGTPTAAMMDPLDKEKIPSLRRVVKIVDKTRLEDALLLNLLLMKQLRKTRE